jgi:hypothetical protein
VILASTILDSASTTLLDTAHRTWTSDELLGYLNEALRATALVKADFYVVETPLALVAGVKQVLPGDAVALVDVPRNSSGGEIITQVDKTLLDESNRFWPSGTAEATVEHYTEDPRNPRRFVVFPPNDGTGIVDVIYGAVPPQVMYAAEEMTVPDAYQSALTNFVLSKAYAKNSKRQDLSKSAASMQAWGQALGMKSQTQIAIAPRVASEPGTT